MIFIVLVPKVLSSFSARHSATK